MTKNAEVLQTELGFYQESAGRWVYVLDKQQNFHFASKTLLVKDSVL